MILQVISAIDGSATVEAFPLFDEGSQWFCLRAASLEGNWVFILVLGSFYWTLHRLFDLSYLLVSHRKNGFEFSIGQGVVAIHCSLCNPSIDLKRKKKSEFFPF